MGWARIWAIALTGAQLGCAASTSYDELGEIPLYGPRQAGVQIHIQAGELRLCGRRGRRLLTVFEHEGRPPQVRYSQADSRGTLVVEDTGDGERPAWNLCLDDRVVVDLGIHTGGADSDLRLDNVDLRSLALDLGRGRTAVTLAGAVWRNAQIHIDGGAGDLQLFVAEEVGVQLVVVENPGAGKLELAGLHRHGRGWINDAYGASPGSLDIHLDMGSGDVRYTHY